MAQTDDKSLPLIEAVRDFQAARRELPWNCSAMMNAANDLSKALEAYEAQPSHEATPAWTEAMSKSKLYGQPSSIGTPNVDMVRFAASATVPTGWKLMPPELTEEMKQADRRAAEEWIQGDHDVADKAHGQAIACYRAVFAAAPSAATDGGAA